MFLVPQPEGTSWQVLSYKESKYNCLHLELPHNHAQGTLRCIMQYSSSLLVFSLLISKCVSSSRSKSQDLKLTWGRKVCNLETLFVVRFLVVKSSPTLRPHELQPARPLCPWNFPGKNTVVGCHALLQVIFPALGWNPCLLRLLNWKADSLPLSPLGSPETLLKLLKTVQ